MKGFAAFCFFLHGASGSPETPSGPARPVQSHRGTLGQCWAMCLCIRRRLRGPGGRTARLFDLTADEERTTREGAGADPESGIFGFFENPQNHRAVRPPGPRKRRLMHKRITPRCPSIPRCTSVSLGRSSSAVGRPLWPLWQGTKRDKNL